MQLEHTTDQNIKFIQLPRRILMADAKETKKSLQGFLGEKQTLLALDMSAVEFIDSSGLAVLINCLQSCRRNSGDICLFGMRDTVRTLFEITRLHSLFPIVANRMDAVARLTS